MSNGSKPALQKLMESPFLLLLLGIVVMLVFYTGWGMFEVMNMPQATLPQGILKCRTKSCIQVYHRREKTGGNRLVHKKKNGSSLFSDVFNNYFQNQTLKSSKKPVWKNYLRKVIPESFIYFRRKGIMDRLKIGDQLISKNQDWIRIKQIICKLLL